MVSQGHVLHRLLPRVNPRKCWTVNGNCHRDAHLSADQQPKKIATGGVIFLITKVVNRNTVNEASSDLIPSCFPLKLSLRFVIAALSDPMILDVWHESVFSRRSILSK
jgi:hypothetical protein